MKGRAVALFPNRQLFSNSGTHRLDLHRTLECALHRPNLGGERGERESAGFFSQTESGNRVH